MATSFPRASGPQDQPDKCGDFAEQALARGQGLPARRISQAGKPTARRSIHLDLCSVGQCGVVVAAATRMSRRCRLGRRLARPLGTRYAGGTRALSPGEVSRVSSFQSVASFQKLWPAACSPGGWEGGPGERLKQEAAARAGSAVGRPPLHVAGWLFSPLR